MKKEKAIKILLTEGKKTYKEFSAVKLIIFSFIGIELMITISVSAFLLLSPIVAIIITLGSILIGSIIIWNGLRWKFPRYMALDKILQTVGGKKRIKRHRPSTLSNENYIFLISAIVMILNFLFYIINPSSEIIIMAFLNILLFVCITISKLNDVSNLYF